MTNYIPPKTESLPGPQYYYLENHPKNFYPHSYIKIGRFTTDESLIADVFFQAGFIEQWGHGTIKMINACSKAGLRDPAFEQESGGMQVIFLKDILNEEYLRRLSLNDRQINAVLFTKQQGAKQGQTGAK